MSVSAPPVFTVASGKPFSASLIVPAGVPAALIGARVEAPVTRAIASMFRLAVLGGLTLTVTLDAPAQAGGYELVWRSSDGEPPSYEAMVPLVVTDDIGPVATPFPKIDPQDVRPTVDDVAQLERTRTVEVGGGDGGGFDDTTSPTADEVEQIIDQAVDDVISELPQDEIDPRHYRQIERASAIQAALLIETSWFREQANDAAVRVLQQTHDGLITGLTARINSDLEQQNLLGGMEPYTVTTSLTLA